MYLSLCIVNFQILFLKKYVDKLCMLTSYLSLDFIWKRFLKAVTERQSAIASMLGARFFGFILTYLEFQWNNEIFNHKKLVLKKYIF